MNDNLYNEIVNNGLGLNSPSIDGVSDGLSTLNNASTAVDSLPIAEPPATVGVPQALVDDTNAAIDGALASMTSAQTHMQTNVNNVFSNIVSASTVNRIESVSGCDYLTNLTGSIMGDADPFITSISGNAQTQIDAINDYLASIIDVDALTTALESANGLYKDFEDSLNGLIANESALMGDLQNKITSSSLAKSVALLWNDPCAQAILDNTLSDDVKGILNNGQ